MQQVQEGAEDVHFLTSSQLLLLLLLLLDRRHLLRTAALGPWG